MTDRKDLISLSDERAKRSNDAKDTTPVDVMKNLLGRIESGELPIDKVVIITNEETPSGSMCMRVFASGTTKLEAIGMMSIALTAQADG